MRFVFCKFHCPSFICFCKPSSHIYSPGPLKLENSPHVPSTIVSASGSDGSNQLSVQTPEVKNEETPDEEKQQRADECVKSSVRKKTSLGPKETRKKKVQWMDFAGKDLVEIREFETCDVESTKSQGGGSHVCTIL